MLPSRSFCLISKQLKLKPLKESSFLIKKHSLSRLMPIWQVLGRKTEKMAESPS
jgi:hypothetical protein